MGLLNNLLLCPGCKHLSPPHKHGVIEHVIVVDGGIEILVNGTWQYLKTGEGLRFNANQPHGYRNSTSQIACFHDIVHYSEC
jgi:XRE family transcriptional regulator, regulator of sulfur utilization